MQHVLKIIGVANICHEITNMAIIELTITNIKSIVKLPVYERIELINYIDLNFILL